MAKSALELAVETGKWDAGLKKAKSALDSFTDANGGLQQALGKDSDKMQKFVQMMGGFESTAKTAKGQMNDYKSTIEALTIQYNRMTDAQKAAIGQDYLRSIDQIRQKYQAVAEEVQKINQSLSQTPKADALSSAMPSGGGLFGGDKLSGMLQVFGGNLMTKTAGTIASLGTEMFNSVQQGIELAKQGEGIRIAFERIGRGDLLDGLRQATHGTITDLELMKAAVRFDDFKLPLDQLGTMLAFAQQKAKDTGQSFDYMVESIVTGLGRQSPKILDNLGLSITEIHQKTKETGDMTKAVGQIIREQMAKAGDYVETAADRAAQANVNLQNKMEELGRKFAPLEEASNSLWTSMKIGILDIIGGPLATLLNQLTQAGRIRNEMQNMGGSESVNKQLGALRLAKGRGATGYMTSRYNQDIADYQKQISDLDFKIAAFGKGRDSIERGHIERLKEQKAAVQALMAEYKQGAQQIMNATNVANAAVTGGTSVGGGVKSGKGGSSKGFDISSIAFDANKAGLAAAMSEGDDTSDVWKALTDNMKESKDTIEELTDALVALNKAEGITASGSDNKPKNDDKEKESTANDIRSVAEGVGSMVSGLNQLGIELPAGLSELLGGFQAFTSILSGIASIVAVIAGIQVAKATPVIGWLLARGGTNRNGRIIHAATGYTVPGNFMSGDQVPAMLNSGETVLNKAQTAHLENELTNNQPRAMRVNGRISGHDIVLAADRSLAQEGKGHIVTWK